MRTTPPSATNLNGTVTDTYEYDAFGYLLTSSGTTPNSYLYRAEQYDSDLGLYYLRARYYNPLTGRFLSRDPEDAKITVPASLHKYLYAGAEPVNWIDPTGRDDLSETGELELKAPAEEEGIEKTEEAEDDALCVADDVVSLAAYWASLQGPAPVQSYPFNIVN